jgi:hypothetical protein
MLQAEDQDPPPPKREARDCVLCWPSGVDVDNSAPSQSVGEMMKEQKETVGFAQGARYRCSWQNRQSKAPDRSDQNQPGAW